MTPRMSQPGRHGHNRDPRTVAKVVQDDVGHGTATPVQCLALVHTFTNKAAAARFYGVNRNVIAAAVENGTLACGMWWRYSDMPAVHQPLRDARLKPVIRDDGVQFESMTMAVEAELGTDIDRATRRREQMQIRRKVARGKPYRGHIYRLLTARDLEPSSARGTPPASEFPQKACG